MPYQKFSLIMKLFFALSLLFFWGISCSSQQKTPLKGIHEYTETQKAILKQWKQSRQIQQNYGPSRRETTETPDFIKNQMTGKFRQPLAPAQISHGKRCQADHGCQFGFSCVRGICVGGVYPEKYGKCIRSPLADMICSNTGGGCTSHNDCIL